MIWNYRIIRHCSEEREDWFGLHEVYYDEAGAPENCTEDPIEFVASQGEDAGAIIESLELALRDARKYPVLVECDGKLEEPDPWGYLVRRQP